MTIGAVAGGEETNPLWTSEVGNDAFSAALERNLVLAGARARDEPSAAYRPDATIVGVDQPSMGLDTNVTSTVQDITTPLAGGEPSSTPVIESFAATFADAARGLERLPATARETALAGAREGERCRSTDSGCGAVGRPGRVRCFAIGRSVAVA